MMWLASIYIHITRSCKSFARDSSGAITIIFVFLIPLFFMLIALGTEGPRYLTEKARLSDVLEQASLALTAEDNINTVEDEIEAKARNKLLVTRYIDTLMPRRNEGKSAEVKDEDIKYKGVMNSTPGGEASFIEYRVTAQSPHLSWFDSSIFPAFDKEVSVGEGGAARKYIGGLDVLFVLDFSESMEKNSISGSSTRLVALKEALTELIGKVGEMGSANRVGVLPFDWGTVDKYGDCRVYLKLSSVEGSKIDFVTGNPFGKDEYPWSFNRWYYTFASNLHFLDRYQFKVAGREADGKNEDLLNHVNITGTIEAIADPNEAWDDILIPKRYYSMETFPERSSHQCHFSSDGKDLVPDSGGRSRSAGQSFSSLSATTHVKASSDVQPFNSDGETQECGSNQVWNETLRKCDTILEVCKDGKPLTESEQEAGCKCWVPWREPVNRGMCLRKTDGTASARTISLQADGSAVINQVNDMTAEGNTFIAPAMIEGAVSLIREAKNSRRVLVVVSDGEDHPNEKVSKALIDAGLCQTIRDGLTTDNAQGKLVFIGIGYKPQALPLWEQCVGKQNLFFPETLDQLKESLHRAVFEEVGRNTIK
jgi:Flp pilus assembly protein TadG